MCDALAVAHPRESASSYLSSQSLAASRNLALRYTGQTISLIMRNLLIAISNSATISSEELIAELHNVWSYENTTMRWANSDY